MTCSYAFMLPVATPPNAIAHEVNPLQYMFCVFPLKIQTLATQASGMATSTMMAVGLALNVFCICVNMVLPTSTIMENQSNIFHLIFYFSRWRSTHMPSPCLSWTHSQSGQTRLQQWVVKQTISIYNQATNTRINVVSTCRYLVDSLSVWTI